MLRRFRILGVGLLAVAATAAFGAQAAAASKIVASAGAVTAHGTQSLAHHWVFTDNNNLTVSCTTKTFEGTIPAGGTETPILHPTYSGCTAFGLSSTVSTTGCYFEFHIGALSGHSAPASTDIECGSGAIRIVTLTCEIDIWTQQGLTSNTFTNNTVSGDVLIDTQITGVDYTVTKDGIGCPLSKVGHFTDADYTGTTTLQAPSGTLQVQ